MSFAVLCTFDLENASSSGYESAYDELEKLGLYKAQSNNSGGETVIPTTTVLGSYTGSSASSIRDDVRSKIKSAFSSLGLKSEIFVVVGGEDWTWGATTS